MKKWIFVWEVVKAIPQLEAPVGSHLVFHCHHSLQRMVFHLVHHIGGEWVPGAELSPSQLSVLLHRPHHLKMVWSQAPSEEYCLRTAIERAGGHAENPGLQLMA